MELTSSCSDSFPYEFRPLQSGRLICFQFFTQNSGITAVRNILHFELFTRSNADEGCSLPSSARGKYISPESTSCSLFTADKRR